jgi:hypothetical protein
MDVLDQIRELDDEDGEFSREMVYAFFIQAEQTFGRMDDALYVLFTVTCCHIVSIWTISVAEGRMSQSFRPLDTS